MLTQDVIPFQQLKKNKLKNFMKSWPKYLMVNDQPVAVLISPLTYESLLRENYKVQDERQMELENVSKTINTNETETEATEPQGHYSHYSDDGRTGEEREQPEN